jgi:NAD(P)-dependent dehydrogenase (short-subunit alcohol dehydrogenase family)
LDIGLEQIRDASGQVEPELDRDALSGCFPALASKADPSQLACMLATTRLVGMICPGLHSLFSELLLKFGPQETDSGGTITWHTGFCHDELRFAELLLQSDGLNGRIGAFVRPPPVHQTGTAELKAMVPGCPFAGRNALVVGGSRGLGEVAAKLLAAGGADVALSYAAGEADAGRIVGDIGSAGGSARALHLNIDDPELPEGHFSHVYYFASPKIRQGPRGKFDHTLFQSYLSFFVTGFETLVRALPAPVEIVYPSTVFVHQPEARFAEYIAAKAAGEALCDYLDTHRAGITVRVVRLPRLRTDQNATVAGPTGADPADAILALLQP